MGKCDSCSGVNKKPILSADKKGIYWFCRCGYKNTAKRFVNVGEGVA